METEIQIGQLPVDAWRCITSYLDAQALLALTKASNKAIRQKLLRFGGVQEYHIPGSHSQHFLSSGFPVAPYVAHPLSNWSLLPPPAYFSSLRTLRRGYTPLTNSFEVIEPDMFPPTLTHLDYLVHPCKIEGHIAADLPNLRHFGFICDKNSPHELVGSLPITLTSLSLQLQANHTDLDSLFAAFPPELTQLTLVGNRIGRNIIDIMDRPLPPTLVDLSLPVHAMLSETRDADILDTLVNKAPWCKLESFHVQSIEPIFLGHLPPSLTCLSIEKRKHERDVPYDAMATCPKTIETLRMGSDWSQLPHRCPGVTRFQIGDYEKVHRWNSWDEELFDFKWQKTDVPSEILPKFLPNVVVIDLPYLHVGERYLDQMPFTIQRLTVLTVCFDGTSLPNGIESLNFENRQSFVDFRSWCELPYQLVILEPTTGHIFSTRFKVPKTVKHIQWDRTDSNPYFLSDKKKIPPQLQSLHHFEVARKFLGPLPNTITALTFCFQETTLSVELSWLLAKFPGLKKLSTYTPSARRGTRASLEIQQKHLPTSMKGAPPTIKINLDGTVSSLVPTVTSDLPLDVDLPKDAISRVYAEAKAAGVTLEGFGFREHDSFREAIGLWAGHSARISGTYILSMPLIRTGFGRGIVKLDITGATFLDDDKRNPQIVLPALPDTLLQLSLGNHLSVGILRNKKGNYHSCLPSSLKTLYARIEDRSDAFTFRLAPLPASLVHLEIRMSSEPIKEQHVQPLTVLFPKATSTTEKDSEGFFRIVAMKEDVKGSNEHALA